MWGSLETASKASTCRVHGIRRQKSIKKGGDGGCARVSVEDNARSCLDCRGPSSRVRVCRQNFARRLQVALYLYTQVVCSRGIRLTHVSKLASLPRIPPSPTYARDDRQSRRWRRVVRCGMGIGCTWAAVTAGAAAVFTRTAIVRGGADAARTGARRMVPFVGLGDDGIENISIEDSWMWLTAVDGGGYHSRV